MIKTDPDASNKNKFNFGIEYPIENSKDSFAKNSIEDLSEDEEISICLEYFSDKEMIQHWLKIIKYIENKKLDYVSSQIRSGIFYFL